MRQPLATDPETGADRESSAWSWIVPTAVVAALVGLYFGWPAFGDFVDEAIDVLSSGDEARVGNWVDQFGPWGFVAIIGLFLFQTVVAFLPSLVTMVVSVLAYGPVVGGLLAWGGLLLAAGLGYGIGRVFGPAVVGGMISGSTEDKIRSFVDDYGTWGVVAARISPVFSTDAVSIVAGLVGMNFARFLVATAAGTLPLAVLVGWLGQDIERLQAGLIAVSVVSLLVFVGYVAWDRRSSS